MVQFFLAFHPPLPEHVELFSLFDFFFGVPMVFGKDMLGLEQDVPAQYLGLWMCASCYIIMVVRFHPGLVIVQNDPCLQWLFILVYFFFLVIEIGIKIDRSLNTAASTRANVLFVTDYCE